MSQSAVDNPLSEEQRKEIFVAIVDAQDRELGVAAARKEVAAQFGVSADQVRQIEVEGVDNTWPPLQ